MQITKKIIIPLLLITIVIFGIILGFIFYGQNKIKGIDKQGEVNKTAESAAPAEPEKFNVVEYKPMQRSNCDSKTGQEKEICLNYFIANDAFTKNKIENCKIITDPEIQYYCVFKFITYSRNEKQCSILTSAVKRNECIRQLAITVGKIELCDLTDSKIEKEKCLGPFMAMQGAATGNVAECKKIKIVEYANLCFEKLVNKLGRDCTKLTENTDKQKCEDIIALESALKSGNKDTCGKIHDEIRKKVCQNLIDKGRDADSDSDRLTDIEELTLGTDPFSEDTDKDGLKDRDEIKRYGTDPLNPDTDGDGYTDGEEISKGFDPLVKNK